MSDKLLKSCAKGLIVSLVCSVVLLVVFGFISYLQTDPDKLLQLFSVVILLVSAFAGGGVAAKSNGEKGLVAGAISGTAFILITLLCSFCVGEKTESTGYLIFVLSILVSAFAGKLLSGKSKRKKKSKRKER